MLKPALMWSLIAGGSEMGRIRKSSPAGMPKRLHQLCTDLANDQATNQDGYEPASNKIKLDYEIPAAFARLRAVTPEPRVCVYGCPQSVPFYMRAAL